MSQRIGLVSSDLNGTLVHEHTMSDMIRIYVGQEQFERANAVFKKQTSGQASMEDAFETAGPLTKGLTLRQAIEYTQDHMTYVKGFPDFVDFLAQSNVPLVINSTGYSVTIHAIREQVGRDRIHGQIGNRLIFGIDADPNQALRDDELEERVVEFFEYPPDPYYDAIKAVGRVELGIKDEAAKAQLINQYVRKHFPQIGPSQIAHMGDTMGDCRGILDIARQGGTGVAFNYNNALEQYLKDKMKKTKISGRIEFVDKKSKTSDLKGVISYLK